MKRIISLTLLLCCLVLVSCKDKEYEELKQKYETLQKDKETMELERNNFKKEYDNLKAEYEEFKLKVEILQKNYDDSKKKYKNLKESSKLSNKSESEIQKIRYQEMQEKLKSFGLKIENIKTYWLWERVNDGLFVVYFKFYPCIRIELANTNEKRLDSVIVNAFFTDFGNAHAVIDNLHPGYNKVITITSPVFKKSDTGDTKIIPNIEADIKFSINDGKDFSIGLIKIDKVFEKK